MSLLYSYFLWVLPEGANRINSWFKERKLVRNRKQTNLRTQNPKSLIPKLFLIPQSSTSIPLEIVELSNSHSSVDVLYLNLSSEGLKEDLAYQTLTMKLEGRML
ncbi:hypothetical protein ES288_D12G087300v1 [Gossypium darwinii]|uniref:Uncharacterized protein n=1 Tax=Gossypium darwinii TaxID=34276 RepID=A0A5D2A7K0_GOSDA|nr:hypothetical protein ES288_D12G087300v1 [Gossypium darwinii]